MIALELARELKVAGLPWQPHRGDLAMDRLNVPFLVVADGTDDAGGVSLDVGRSLERRPFLGITWIPRLDQLLAFIARYGPVDLAVRRSGEDRRDARWELTLVVNGEPRRFGASDGADAAGLALHHLLAEVGWHPGPPLPGESR